MNLNFKKDIIPHAIVVLIFALVSYLYFMPNFNGKVHNESDMFQTRAMSKEITDVAKEEGETPLWTTSIFSGMPSQILKGKDSHNLIKTINYLLPFRSAKYPFKILFLSLLCAYILAVSMKIDWRIAIIAAFAYGFATFSISGIEAAHYTKGLTMALMPAVLAGFIFLTRKKYFLGFLVLAYHFALQVYWYHYQISYYTGIMLLVAGVTFAVIKIKEGELKHVLLVALFSVIAGGLAVSSNFQKLKSTQSYAEESMRGGSDLAPYTNEPAGQNTTESGLGIDYAFQWSYGIYETFTGIIPNLYGGSSNETISKSTDFYKQTRSEKAPTYYGPLPFTGGPVYFGALAVFLFVLGVINSNGWMKWSLIAIGIFSLILAWGKHFGLINNFLFYNLPFYDKFRTPMMAMSITQVITPALGAYGLHLFIKQEDKKKAKEDLILAGYIVGGIIVVVGLVFGLFYSFEGDGDGRYQPQLVELLVDLRKSLLRTDAIRSLVFAGVGFGALWLYLKGTLKITALSVILGIAMLADLGGVAKRYMAWDDFNIRESSIKSGAEAQPRNVDLQIMQDKSYYRVYDMSRDPFNDNTGAFFHHMVGGYHPAKLSRYQDVIARHLKNNNQRVLDMLNAKYIIGKAQQSEEVIAQQRPTALGNAWFVDELTYAQNPLEEIDFLKDFNPAKQAVAEIKYKDLFGSVNPTDSNATIEFVSYHPDTLVYKYNSNTEALAVFSELFYDKLWNAYLDGEPIDHGRVNYILRGAKLPTGNHQLVFIAEDKDIGKDLLVERVSSVLILAGFPIYLLLMVIRRRKEDE